ncbi:MAG: hypothetical protein WAX14_21875 [Rhodococcus sp. (in: high G+C Gram-positive bacteria)]|uniref:hypothetical protein n=1 Tax=Rhodococcus sp. TaxID=1831 RepID=UPI003BB792E2
MPHEQQLRAALAAARYPEPETLDEPGRVELSWGDDMNHPAITAYATGTVIVFAHHAPDAQFPIGPAARPVADSLAILWPLIAHRIERAAAVPAGSIPEPAGAHITSPLAFLDERADAVYAQYLDGTYLWIAENPDRDAPDLPATAAALIGTRRGDQLGITAQTAVAVDYADGTILINPAAATPSALERDGRWYPVITFPGLDSPSATIELDRETGHAAADTARALAQAAIDRCRRVPTAPHRHNS